MKGQTIFCIKCGHRFIADETAEAAPILPEVAGSSQKDWQQKPPPVRSQPPPEQLPILPPDDKDDDEPDVIEFGELGDAHSELSLENTVDEGPRDRTRIKFAVMAVVFSVLSLACLGAGVHTRLLPWIYGSAASAYLGAHMSIFSSGPIRIVGALLNIMVMVGCIGSLILLTRGLR
jgi:hypothetical protein